MPAVDDPRFTPDLGSLTAKLPHAGVPRKQRYEPHRDLPGAMNVSPHEVQQGIYLTVRRTDLVNDSIRGSTVDLLLDDLARFSSDPKGFVKWAFPWGEPGTVLEDWAGPEQWQEGQQDRIGKRLRHAGANGCVIEEDVASGHGVGKSAEVAWMILWAISTHEDTRGVVTANTEQQLKNKTWAELGKWYQLFVGKHLFTLTATAIYIANDKEREKTWRIDMVPWTQEKTEAFAGLHNQGKRIIVIFDEASAIHDKIWEVTEGALTDAKTQILWLRYGNPTRTSGQFFTRMSQPKRNIPARVDSRFVSFTNKAQINAWIDDYGEDSDFVRVRVKGMFPRAGFDNFMAPGLFTSARMRRLDPATYVTHQKVLSCDPARFGDDSTVITLRQGLKVHWQLELSGFDGADIANRLASLVQTGGKVKPDDAVPQGPISCIVYDAVGNGAELDGFLRRMKGLPALIPVQWGQPAKDSDHYFNQRAEAWGKMRDWMEHASVPNEDSLQEQACSLAYGYDAKFRIQLESKKDAKKRGVKSPDRADSLALSFIPELIDRKVAVAKVRPTAQRKVIWTQNR